MQRRDASCANGSNRDTVLQATRRGPDHGLAPVKASFNDLASRGRC